MEPTIELGDRVRVEACARVCAGDIILFEASRGYVLHRVIARLPGTQWVRHFGDARFRSRPGLVRIDRVVGRATSCPKGPLPRQLASPRVYLASVIRLLSAGRSRLSTRLDAWTQTIQRR